ncbi:unnamed protein product [Leptidea sinapis]|uniref:BTB domain-containing protein n=1 Tax=Leptidea sinapis TaxID=189913 RepID=A0A5E4R7M8_9NEOP|nr:unnamed protein product [Leptidea sinapis]
MTSIFERHYKEGSKVYKCGEYATKVSSSLNHFRSNGRFCDLELISGRTKVQAHRVVLAASCEYFDAMFNVGLEESLNGRVMLHSVPPSILPLIIDFIYTETHNCMELAEEALAHAQAHWDLVANGDELVELPLQQLKSGRGALVSLSAEPRARARRLLVVVGGSCHNTAQHPPLTTDNILFSALKFDLHKRKWEDMSAMGIARIQPGVATLRGKVYAVGGEQGSKILANGEIKFKYNQDIWEDMGSLREGRAGCAAGAAEGVIIVAGGDSESGGERTFYRARTTLDSVEIYVPSEDLWKAGPPMPHSRAEAGSALL